jgi:hypothetical protein
MKDATYLTSLLIAQGKTINRKQVRPVLFAAMLGLFCGLAHGQDIATLDKAYHPGEPLHVIFTFASQVDLSSGGVTFNLNKLENEAQRLWTRGFNLTEIKVLQPTQYEATGRIPEYAATGVYRLIRAWSSVSDLSKGYDYPDTLHQDITVRVINERRDPLPALIDLKLVR